jgi:site-specific recombinase XerD
VKERRSGSGRTAQAYSRMLFDFFGALGKIPDLVSSQEVFAYAHSVGASRRKPSSVTVGARIACRSSFYKFLIRMGLVAANPCDQLERPRPTRRRPGAWLARTYRGSWR